MDNIGYIALSASMMRRRTIDISANNMANANTAGFKSERGMFEEYVQRAAGDKTGPKSFVVDRGSLLETEQGGMTQTGNPLDVALQGDGWLSYQTEGGERTYGRDGRMAIDAQGNLVTLTGAAVLDAGGGPIAIPADAGQVTITSGGSITDEQGGVIAQIGVFNIPDIQRYSRMGSGMFAPPQDAAAVAADLDTTVHQGFVEQSNVNSISEMTRMMEVQRAYDRASKLIDNTSELRKSVISRLGRPA